MARRAADQPVCHQLAPIRMLLIDYRYYSANGIIARSHHWNDSIESASLATALVILWLPPIRYHHGAPRVTYLIDAIRSDQFLGLLTSSVASATVAFCRRQSLCTAVTHRIDTIACSLCVFCLAASGDHFKAHTGAQVESVSPLTSYRVHLCANFNCENVSPLSGHQSVHTASVLTRRDTVASIRAEPHHHFV